MAVKVLILEDNPAAREFLGRVVRESFWDTITIVEAGDLESARRAVRIAGGAQGYHGVDPFKLILVDLELPDGSGLELLDELRQYPATKIVTTLYSDDEHLFPALQAGADGYLLKEDRFELLVEELQKIVRGEPPLSPAIARRLLGHFRTNTRTGMNRRINDEGNGAALRSGSGASALQLGARVRGARAGRDRAAAGPARAHAARGRGAHLPQQGLHDQGDRGADVDQVVHGQRPHQVDLPQAQRVQPRRGGGAGEQAGARVSVGRRATDATASLRAGPDEPEPRSPDGLAPAAAAADRAAGFAGRGAARAHPRADARPRRPLAPRRHRPPAADRHRPAVHARRAGPFAGSDRRAGHRPAVRGRPPRRQLHALGRQRRGTRRRHAAAAPDGARAAARRAGDAGIHRPHERARHAARARLHHAGHHVLAAVRPGAGAGARRRRRDPGAPGRAQPALRDHGAVPGGAAAAGGRRRGAGHRQRQPAGGPRGGAAHGAGRHHLRGAAQRDAALPDAAAAAAARWRGCRGPPRSCSAARR